MNLATLDLNLLRILSALLQEKSTVKAGVRVGLSQPAVSAALGRLREALGDPLFVRQGQRMVPTEFAKSLELPLQRIYEDLDAMFKQKDAFDPSTSVTSFMIAGSDFFAELLMPALANLVSTTAPGLRFQLLEPHDPHNVSDLENIQIDLTLRPYGDTPDWTESVPLFKSDHVVIARSGHPRLEAAGVMAGDMVPLDLFCDLGHVLMSMRGALRGLGDVALEPVDRERRVVMSSPGFSGVYNAVSQSDLVALLPHQLAHHAARRFGLSIYRPPVYIAPVTIYMIWHRRRTSSMSHAWLRKTICDIMTPLNDVPLTMEPEREAAH